MIEVIIKRDGREEPFHAAKINGWGLWASETLGDHVDWASGVMAAVGSLPTKATSKALQEELIRYFLNKGTWANNRMAGRLYAALFHKDIYEKDSFPTIQALHQKLISIGYMVPLDYTDDEYIVLNNIIDHRRDFEYAHSQLEQIRNKYSLRNYVTKEEYETPQFVFMRMAMALGVTQPKERRMEDVVNWYYFFSKNKINCPTPNYTNLGTKLNGYASCNLYTVDDNANSLAIGDHIAYMMTVMSAGIGGNLQTRSIGDPVRGGLFSHRGKGPYYRALYGAVQANIKNGRNGACTVFFSAFDPENRDILRLKNPMTPADKQIRGLDYCMMTNKFLGRKAAKNEDVFLFNKFTAPELTKAFYSDDLDTFTKIYHELEQDPSFKKTYMSAREILLHSRNEAYETGRYYWADIGEINRHTPFKDPIYSSNLCVAPETLLLTDKGYKVISNLIGERVNIWNGYEYSEVEVKKTGSNKELWTVKLSDNRHLECTPYHKWYIVDENDLVREVKTHELVAGQRPIKLEMPNNQNYDNPNPDAVIKEVSSYGRYDDTYCVTEPKRHMAVFNGILTGQCVEIVEPTEPYQDMKDLYSNDSRGFIKFRDELGGIHKFQASSKVKLIDGHLDAAQNLKVNDIINYDEDTKLGDDSRITVKEILELKKEPEVALCSLAGIVLPNIEDDEEYEKVMYYALLMVDKCIHMSDYVLPHIGYTAKNRLSAGIGIMSLAHHMAKKHLKYSTLEGKQEIHRVAERHMYYAIKASLKLGQELGNAPWIYRTKWTEGWLPKDTANKNIDSIVDGLGYEYNWEALRKEIIKNGGLRNSTLVAYMPGESSSKASGGFNSVYPARDLSLIKTDGSSKVYWTAPDSDTLAEHYELAWDIPIKDQIEMYGIIQKWTDQSISADLFQRILGDDKISSEDMLQDVFNMYKVGMKTQYYMNSKVSKPVKLDHIDISISVHTEEDVAVEASVGCESGACSL